MALISDIIIWSVITIAIGGGVGLLMGKFYFSILKRKEEKHAIEFMKGNKLNTLKLDGEIINVDKFKFKNSDGKLIEIEAKELYEKAKKISPKPLKEEKIPFLKRILPYSLSYLKNKLSWKKRDKKNELYK